MQTERMDTEFEGKIWFWKGPAFRHNPELGCSSGRRESNTSSGRGDREECAYTVKSWIDSQLLIVNPLCDSGQ